jgi:hypothetical protein
VREAKDRGREAGRRRSRLRGEGCGEMHRKVVAELEIEDHLRDSVPCDEGGAVFTRASIDPPR